MTTRRDKGTGTIFQLPDGRWRGQFDAGYTASGKRRRLTVTAKTKKLCQEKLRDRQQEVSIEGPVAAPTHGMDLKHWIDTWLAERAQTVRPKTYAAESGPLRKYVIPTIGDTQLKDLTPDHIRTVRTVMDKAGCSATLIAYTQRILQQALKDAVMEGKPIPAAVIAMRRPKTSVSDRTAIPVEDAKKLAALSWSIEGNPQQGVQDGSRWIAALLQGMRQGECLGLTWDQVDFQRNLITIRWQLQELPYSDREKDAFAIPPDMQVRRLYGRYFLTPPKSRAGYRTIPMIPAMRERLLAWKAHWPGSPYNLVWPHDASGIPENKSHDLAQWKHLQEVAGIHKGVKAGAQGKSTYTYYVLHEARNATASLLLAAHIEPVVITQILGHSSIVTSEGYMTVTAAQTAKALEQVAKLLDLEGSAQPPLEA
jgi:integrase